MATRAVLLLGLLAAVLAARHVELVRLLAWTDPLIVPARYPPLFAVFFLTWLGATTRYRRAALLAGSLAAAAIFDPWFLALSLPWIAGLHLVLRRTWVAVLYLVETACIGWGIERWMAAIVARWGVDPARWPV